MNAAPDHAERVVLVDAEDRECGVCGKIEAHRRGLRHRAVSVIIRDGDRILLQRRHVGKYHSGGKWANAACGHPRPGESPAQAAERRLREEMGIRCPLRWIGRTHYRADLGDGMVEDEVVHLYLGTCAQDPVPDPVEVMDWCWCPVVAFRRAALVSDLFACWVREYVRQGLI